MQIVYFSRRLQMPLKNHTLSPNELKQPLRELLVKEATNCIHYFLTSSKNVHIQDPLTKCITWETVILENNYMYPYLASASICK